jgi:hypothetical protein
MMNGRHTKNNRDWLRALTGLTFPIHQQNKKKRLGERELLKELYTQHIDNIHVDDIKKKKKKREKSTWMGVIKWVWSAAK